MAKMLQKHQKTIIFAAIIIIICIVGIIINI